MRLIIILFAILLTGCLPTKSAADSKTVEVKSVPFPKELWPEPPKLTKEMQDDIVRSAPVVSGREVIVGGPETKGIVYTHFAGLTIHFPPDVEAMGIVSNAMCMDGHECIKPPYLTIKRDGGHRAFITQDGSIVDEENKFSDVKIIK